MRIKRKTRKRIYLALMAIDLITVLIIIGFTDMPYSGRQYFGYAFTILLTLYCLVPNTKDKQNDDDN
ncbi:hypothetical protein [Staphylococcus warneri]|uniref:hypothetical protein n=1 Tax=Staphylococcus warneri TaxID=1292 RepID=UPI000A9277B9|nr:hypothetical protein [Staphylococcus warneri]